jgi:DNA-binding transcriptional MerR regulator
MSQKKSPEAFRTIGEVAAWLGVSAHVLRFWETKFPQIKPVKRAGGRRYYRPQDMLLLGGLKQLLHEDGLTIRGAQKVLREQGVKAVAARSAPLGVVAAEVAPDADRPDAETPTPSAAEAEAAQEGPAEPGPPAASPPPPPPPPADEGPARLPTVESLPPLAERSGRAVAPDEPEAEPGEPEAEPQEAAAETPAAAQAKDVQTKDVPPRAPLPGADEPQLGLFSDLPPIVPPEPGADPAADAEPAPGRGAAAAPGPGPVVAPLPEEALPVAAALARLSPGDIPAETLAPVLSRAEALRARMDSVPAG